MTCKEVVSATSSAANIPCMDESLQELLGLDDYDRVVVFCGEPLGFSHAENAAVFEALRSGALNSARLVVPGPWIRHAARNYGGEDVGVSLALTCRNEIFHLSPLTNAPSLVDGGGGLPTTAADLWSHADIDELRREVRAQLERALYWGFDVTHLSSFEDSLVERPEFFDIVLDLASEHLLPIRLMPNSTEDRLGYPAKQLVGDRGLVSIDQVVDLSNVKLSEFSSPMVALDEIFEEQLKPGVTEITCSLAIDSPEIRALSGDWESQTLWLEAMLDFDRLTRFLGSRNVFTTTYRRIRDSLRALKTK
ncbi:hypothetical protein SAMN02745225_00139 [Ferrithrix thermotolerans DSM 19514]|jgi:hypothetical protein|uniref:ChbG/HpnK family deacetylase n=1 Tax=Ferrithrix thermotolerans DSM 19514 TaxID=1121881 RepID=A0A1M4S702_9ACTN|nr:ChbG/HpnK family deacetylase [Ferrithrix thermotolerans]SHE27982.1 hypothetical protein SAMN02745225_00139 [Ferrithrix thermotolerans DSM 19514]